MKYLKRILIHYRSWIVLSVLSVAVLLIGLRMLYWAEANRQRHELLQSAVLVASALNVDAIGSLSGTPADLESPLFQNLHGQLRRIQGKNPHFSYIYLMAIRKGETVSSDPNIVFLMDAGEDGVSYPGDIYVYATPELWALFEGGGAFVEGPVEDSWGTWVSALVPLINPVTGEVLAVLGFDRDAGDWRLQVIRKAIIPMGLLTSLMLLGLMLALLARSVAARRRANEALHQQTRLQEMLMDLGSMFISLPVDEFQSTVQITLGKMGDFVKADRVYIFEYSSDYSSCSNTHEWCAEGISPEMNQLQEISTSILPGWEKAHKLGKSLRIDDVNELPENSGLRQLLMSQKIKSLLVIPMMDSGQCLGFVGFDSVRSHHMYSVSEERLLTVFAQMLVQVGRRKRIEEALHLSKLEAEAANRAKGQFLANMSHEIRTPLNGVIGMASILEDSSLSQEQRGQIRILRSCAQSLLGLINDILDISKIEAGKLDFVETVFDLRSLFDELLVQFEQSALDRGLYFETILPAKEQYYVIGDTLRIKQVLINLINNALKFTHEGGICVRADAAVIEAHCLLVKVEVVDSGIGVPKESLNRLFQRFSQLDASSTKRYGGTGLGLAICKELITCMGGNIGVESQVGKGSKFWLTMKLPLASAEACRKGGEDWGKLLPGEKISDPKTKILLVDDNAVNRLVAQKLLQRFGLVVEHAENGAEALGKLRTQNYDLVFMDVQMPVMDGFEATQRIREFSAVPIIAITAHAMEGDREACLSVGMNDYLAKPIENQQLKAVLDKWLQ